MSVVIKEGGQCDCNCDYDRLREEVELHAEFVQSFETKYLEVCTECGKLKKEVEYLRSQQPTIATSVHPGVLIAATILQSMKS